MHIRKNNYKQETIGSVMILCQNPCMAQDKKQSSQFTENKQTRKMKANAKEKEGKPRKQSHTQTHNLLEAPDRNYELQNSTIQNLVRIRQHFLTNNNEAAKLNFFNSLVRAKENSYNEKKEDKNQIMKFEKERKGERN